MQINIKLVALIASLSLFGCEKEKPPTAAHSVSLGANYHAALASTDYTFGSLKPDDESAMRDEMTFQRATQLYLWALPSLNMYGMKEGSEAKFGKGYNVLPIFKDRLNAKTIITTPNSDVIYALGYVDLKEDGPVAPLAKLTGNSGAVMSVSPAPTEGRAANTSSSRRISKAQFRRTTNILSSNPKLMVCLFSGADFSKTPSNWKSL